MASDNEDRERRREKRRARRAAEALAASLPPPQIQPAKALEPVLDLSQDMMAELGDIDAWDIRQEGGFWTFQAHLPNLLSPWRLARQRQGGAIFAQAPGPIWALLGYGDGRRVAGAGHRLRFPYHVMRAASAADQDPCLLRSHTRPHLAALIADALLGGRRQAFLGLRLVIASETDLSVTASIADTLLKDLAGLANLAAQLRRPLRLAAISIDLRALGDLGQDRLSRRNNVAEVLTRLCAHAADQGFGHPAIITCFDYGKYWQGQDATLAQLQQDLLWRGGSDAPIFAAPAYIFAQDYHGNLTQSAFALRADYEAAALRAHWGRPEGWTPPAVAFVEKTGPKCLRLLIRANQPLEIDTTPDFAKAAHAGITLLGPKGQDLSHHIKTVEVDASDPKAVLVWLNKAVPEGTVLRYAWGEGHPNMGQEGVFYPASGAIRERIERDAQTGEAGEHAANLAHWLMPCCIPITEGEP